VILRKFNDAVSSAGITGKIIWEKIMNREWIRIRILRVMVLIFCRADSCSDIN